MSGLTFVPIGGRKKEPMRGGLRPEDFVRGNTDRGFLTWLVYVALARGDFHHDFGEGTKTRDLIVPDDGERFYEIAKLVSTKGKVWLMTQFYNYIKHGNNTLYKILKPSEFVENLVPDQIDQPPLTARIEEYDEVGLLNLLGVDYTEIKRITTERDRDPIQKQFNFSGGIGSRRYLIRSSSYRHETRKMGEARTLANQTNKNIASMFRAVTGDATTFALIVDATGGLALSDVLNGTLVPKPDTECNFYIIENIENSSDSADKVKHIKRSITDPNTNLFYLRDIVDTVTYPLWDKTGDPKSNIFSKMSIVLNRMHDETIDAAIDVGGGQLIHVGDVSNASNVKNATLKALAVMIEKGKVPEVFVYTLIKRMGDWCQALSLLDMDRAYEILNPQHVRVGGPTTLAQLSASGAEIGVVTNDRILVAFCILHGLNVFFTSAMDIARLIYFKNMEDVADPATRKINDWQRILKTASETGVQYASLQTDVGEQPPILIAQILAAALNVFNSPSLPNYIASLKNFTANVSRLTDITFAEEWNAVNITAVAVNTAVGTDFSLIRPDTPLPPGDIGPVSTAVNEFAGALTKLRVNIDNVKKIAANLERPSYAGKTVVDIRTQALGRRLATGARVTKSIEVTEAKEILFGMRDDANALIERGVVKQVFLQQATRDLAAQEAAARERGEAAPEVTPDLINTTANDYIRRLFTPQNPAVLGTVPGPAGEINDRVQSNHTEVLSALVPIQLSVNQLLLNQAGGGRQKGGATGEQVNAILSALTKRTIRLISFSPPAGDDPTPGEYTSRLNTYQQYKNYIDDDLRQYTVIDQYIITNDDLSTFDLFFNDFLGTEASDSANYICKRYLLLMYDNLRFEYDRWKDDYDMFIGSVAESQRDIENDAIIPGHILYERLWRIGNLLTGIESCASAFTLESTLQLSNTFKDNYEVPDSRGVNGSWTDFRTVDTAVHAAFARTVNLIAGLPPGAISDTVFGGVVDSSADVLRVQTAAKSMDMFARRLGEIAFASVQMYSTIRDPLVRDLAPTPTGQDLVNVIWGAILDDNNTNDYLSTVDEMNKRISDWIERISAAVKLWFMGYRQTEADGAERNVRNHLVDTRENFNITGRIFAIVPTAGGGRGRKTHRRRLPKLI